MGVRKKIAALLKSNNTPHEIAFGAALGVFIGIMPIYGLHIYIVLLCAFLLPDINRLAIFIGSNISILPTVPFITLASYNIGKVILYNAPPPLEWATLRHLKYQDLPHIYYTLLLGSVVLGLICAIITYFIAFWAAVRLQRR